MSDGEGYDDAIGGKLQLKFGANAVVKADKKSKKKKKKDKKSKKRKAERDDEAAAAPVPASYEPVMIEPVAQPELTPTERKFLEVKRQRDEERLRKVAAKSHRERVAEFNEKLAGLTEHYDLPRIGPG